MMACVRLFKIGELMIVLSLFLQQACLTADITKTPGEFPDNPQMIMMEMG